MAKLYIISLVIVAFGNVQAMKQQRDITSRKIVHFYLDPLKYEPVDQDRSEADRIKAESQKEYFNNRIRQFEQGEYVGARLEQSGK